MVDGPITEILEHQTFEIADVVVSIHSQGIIYPEGPSPFYTPFRSQKKPDIEIIIKKEKKLPRIPAKEKMIFDGTPSWKLYQEDKNYRMEIYSFQTGKRDRSVSVSPDFKKVVMSVEKTNWNFQTIMRPLIEIIFVNYLAPKKGLLLHAASIRDADKGYAFIGKSGAGKTTTTFLWKDLVGDFSILGDERMILRKKEGQWYVYGTPWPGIGMVIENKTIPLTHVFSIMHGKKNEMIQTSPLIMFQDIFAQIFSSFWSEECLSQLAANCHELIEDVPCHQYAFLRDKSCVDYLRKFTHQNLPKSSPQPVA